jgi:hypothetical protein
MGTGSKLSLAVMIGSGSWIPRWMEYILDTISESQIFAFPRDFVGEFLGHFIGDLFPNYCLEDSTIVDSFRGGLGWRGSGELVDIAADEGVGKSSRIVRNWSVRLGRDWMRTWMR